MKYFYEYADVIDINACDYIISLWWKRTYLYIFRNNKI